MENQIKECFEVLGIIIGDDENFLLSEYITDSVTFISLIVEIENKFEIQIPDEYLMRDALRTFKDVCNMVEALL